MLAVITGASSGIGASFARKLARRGYDLLLIARRAEMLEALARELSNVRVTTLAADLATDAGRERAVAAIQAAPDFGILVNNAGFGSNGYFHETTAASQEDMHRLHVLATVSLTHAAFAKLVPAAQPGTGVINVSSVAAYGTSPQNVSYCATKHWMSAFTEGLATELGGLKSPVKVQALCPGYTYSEFHDRLDMDRSKVPSSLWLTADFVVDESLKGFDRGDVVVIPAWRYR